MTIKELEKDPALSEQLAEEMKALIAGGEDPNEAKIHTLKAHGIEFDENAMRAELVGRMKLEDEDLGEVAGGTTSYSRAYDSCWWDYSCFTVHHQDRNEQNQDCWSNYHCIMYYYSPELNPPTDDPV